MILCKCGCGKETLLASKTTTARGHIKGRPMPFLRGHGRRGPENGRPGQANANFRHGGYGEFKREHVAWSGAIQRCHNPKNHKFYAYGARGIAVCLRWRIPYEGFKNFLADMGKKLSLKYSLERKNVNGDYKPSNCKWATALEQTNNRRPYKMTVITRFTNDEIKTEFIRRGLNL